MISAGARLEIDGLQWEVIGAHVLRHNRLQLTLVKAPVEWCDTGIAAGYCLRCGMCTCSPQSETHARVEDVRCPLHGAGSDHPRVPPDESPGEPVDSPGGPITAPGPSEPGSGPPGRT